MDTQIENTMTTQTHSRRSMLRFGAFSAAAAVPAVAALMSATPAAASLPCEFFYCGCTGCLSGCGGGQCRENCYDIFDAELFCFSECNYQCGPCHTNC